MGRHSFTRARAAASTLVSMSRPGVALAAVGLVTVVLAAAVLAAVFLGGCGTQAVGSATSSSISSTAPSSTSSTSPPTSAQTDPSLPARLDAEVSGGDLAAVVTSNNEFSLAVFQAARKGDQNLVCSPYSLSTALSMTMAGAKGRTQEEMKQVMRFTLPYDRLYPAINALDQSLTGAESFTSANGLWAQAGRTIKQPFVDITGHYYDAALHVYDMDHDYAGVCKIINQWASDKTAGRIKDLMDPADKPDTPLLMMLVNAVHFKADWADPFSSLATQPRPFTRLDGSQTDVQMMAHKTYYAYLKTYDFQAIQLPYEDPRYSMVVLMPAEGTFEEFAAHLDAQTVDDTIGRLQRGKVLLGFPRFEIASKPQIKTALQSLGMITAFSAENADFSGIADPLPTYPNDYITDVVQKAFITVNEQGTEAAAVTGVTGAAGAAPTTESYVEMTIDHPFVYLIRDAQNGAILFVGQVVDPQAPKE
jgi:serpin B